MSDMIGEADIAARLKEVFQTPFLDTTVDEDGDIYVSDGLGFPIWVRLEPNNTFVKFFTYMKFDDVEKSAEVLSAVNDLNHNLVVVRFSLNPDQEAVVVDTDYFLNYKGGLLQANLVNAAKRFAATSEFGFQKLADALREMAGSDSSSEEDGA